MLLHRLSKDKLIYRGRTTDEIVKRNEGRRSTDCESILDDCLSFSLKMLLVIVAIPIRGNLLHTHYAQKRVA